jgi:hypothetical protein
MPRSPLPLARRMPVRTAATALIPRAGFSPTPAPLLPRASSGAVPLAVIAVAANAHRYTAAPALVGPERSVSHRNAIPIQDWTMPCDACIKEPWSCLSHAPHRRPGVDRQIPPGPSLIRRRLKNNQDFGARRRQKINSSLSAAALLIGGLFLASKAGLILESAPDLKVGERDIAALYRQIRLDPTELLRGDFHVS